MDDKKAYLGEAVATGRVLVDNSGTPGVTDEVLRDRYNVANDGLIIISIAVDTTHGEIVGDLNLMSKGFHGPAGILDQAKDVLIDLLSSMNPSDIKDLNKVKTESADLVRKFLGKRIKLRPLIVPSVIEV
jgi:ribonuclease J